MTTEELEQATELMDWLSDLEGRYPAVTPTLRDELEALVTKLQTMYSSEVARTSMHVIGRTHTALRQHQRETDGRVAGVIEDMAGLHIQHDAATGLAIKHSQAIAALVEVHTATRLKELEVRQRSLESELDELRKQRTEG